MKNNASNKKRKSESNPELSYSLILLLYAVLPVITPDFNAVDSNGPKFLMLALLNLFSYLFLATRRGFIARRGVQRDFFTSLPGSTYVLFLVISLLSFIKAINISESVLQFSKTFTVFSSVFVLYLVFKKDRRYITQLTIILTILLLVDSLTVFFNIVQYVGGGLDRVSDIKSVYSNKNILASAIFVKLPFSLWLLLYGNGRWKTLALGAIFSAFTATLFISARAFYLGLIILTVLFTAFLLIKYFQSGERRYTLILVKYLLALTFAFLTFTLVQRVFYPHKTDIYNVTFTQRMSSISTEEHSASERIMAWRNSLELIRENPLLGVGSGNWKIADIKYENEVFDTYKYMYKNHNDFIEITAETGVFGGLTFLCLFLFIFTFFIKTIFQKPAPLVQELLFLPAFGCMCYGVDAFFNFPADRPEIQMLFAVFISSGILFLGPVRKREDPPKRAGLPYTILFLLSMGVSIYFLITNVISLRYQRIAWEEMQSGKIKTSSGLMLNGFPVVPGITSYGASISSIKAWYLFEEGKYDDVISLLKNDHSSPFDTYGDHLVGMSYARSGRLDSAMVYFKYVNAAKPLLYPVVAEMCNISADKGDYATAIRCINSYLNKVRDNQGAWQQASLLYEKSNDPERALSMVDSALKYRPDDSLLVARRSVLQSRISLKGFETLYEEGLDNFRKKDYAGAIRNFTAIIDKDPHIAEAYEYRFKCYYFSGQYEKTVSDLDELIKWKKDDRVLFNIRGVCYHNLGKDAEACQDFDTARKMGDQDAESNFRKFCSGMKR